MDSIKILCPKHPREPLIDDHRSGSVVCPKCGLVVVDQIIDESAEWRTFAEDGADTKCRVGATENYLLSSATNLSTSITSTINMNSYGKSIFMRNNRRSVDRALLAAFRVIATISDRINVSQSVTDRACHLYSKVYDKRQLKGNVMFWDPKTAACLYIACHQERVARTSREICGASEYSRKAINEQAELIQRQLQIKVAKRSHSNEFILRFSAALNVKKDVRNDALQIAGQIDQLSFGEGVNQEAMAAAIIFLAIMRSSAENTERLTQDEIGKRLGVNGIGQAYRTIVLNLSKVKIENKAF